MASTQAKEAKEAGTEAWKNEDYAKAIVEWTTAISLAQASSDPEFLKLLYSNRSAAYLKLDQNAFALSDAEQCIRLDPTWTKGIFRKGE